MILVNKHKALINCNRNFAKTMQILRYLNILKNTFSKNLMRLMNSKLSKALQNNFKVKITPVKNKKNHIGVVMNIFIMLD